MWKECTLGDVITLQRGFDLPKQNRLSGSIPIVSSSGITDYHAEFKVKAPGVVTGRYGTIGQVFYIDEDFWALNTTLYVKDFKGNHPLFVYFLLKTIDFNSCSDKSSVPGVNRNDLHLIKVNLPPLSEQKAIARILGALDDKIELNQKMNQTLEAMAQAIFKSWFVDFDPVRAKMAGQQPVGMDEATAALFPDAIEDSVLGEIPKGWKVTEAQNISEIGIGKTPPRKENKWFSHDSSDIRWMSIKDLGCSGVFISSTSEYLKSEAVDIFNIKTIPDNTVVLSFKLTIGRVAITDGEMLSNEAIAHFNLKNSTLISEKYLFLYLKNFKYDSLGNTSSIATAINSKIIKSMPILLPPEIIINHFDSWLYRTYYVKIQLRSTFVV